MPQPGAGYALTYLCQLKLPDPVYAVTSTAVDPSLAEEPHNILPSRRGDRACFAVVPQHVAEWGRESSDASNLLSV